MTKLRSGAGLSYLMQMRGNNPQSAAVNVVVETVECQNLKKSELRIGGENSTRSIFCPQLSYFTNPTELSQKRLLGPRTLDS